MPLDALEDLPPVAEWLSALFEGIADDAGGDAREIYVDEIRVSLPVELSVTGESEDGPSIGISPPTQRIETSVMPVFHYIEVRLAADKPRK